MCSNLEVVSYEVGIGMITLTVLLISTTHPVGETQKNVYAAQGYDPSKNGVSWVWD